MDHYVSKQPCIHTWPHIRFQHTKCELKGKSKMKLKKKWSCNFSKILSYRYMFLSINYSKRGMHAIAIRGRNSHTNFK